MSETNKDQIQPGEPLTGEALSETAENLYINLRTFADRVATQGPKQGKRSDNFDRYWLEPEEGVEPVAAEAYLPNQEMTIVYSDDKGNKLEDMVMLQWPVPGGGTVSPDGEQRSRLTTIIKKAGAEGGPSIVTTETVADHDPEGRYESRVIDTRENDSADVARLKEFLRTAPERLVQEEILTPVQEAEDTATVEAMRQAIEKYRQEN